MDDANEQVPLSVVARQRLKEVQGRAQFETPAGPQAVTKFLALADGRVRNRTKREPTQNQLRNEIRYMAVEESIKFDVLGKAVETTLAEQAQRAGQPDWPELVFGMLYDGVVTGAYLFDKETKTFRFAPGIEEALRQSSDESEGDDEASDDGR